jgi:hypothetical protein
MTRDLERNIYIYTDDKSKVDSSFIDKYNDGVFSKKVDPSNLTNCVSMSSYGIIKNEKVDILKEEDDRIKIGSHSMILGNDLNLERVDRDYWMGWISDDMIQVIREKTPFNPYDL